MKIDDHHFLWGKTLQIGIQVLPVRLSGNQPELGKRSRAFAVKAKNKKKTETKDIPKCEVQKIHVEPCWCRKNIYTGPKISKNHLEQKGMKLIPFKRPFWRLAISISRSISRRTSQLLWLWPCSGSHWNDFGSNTLDLLESPGKHYIKKTSQNDGFYSGKINITLSLKQTQAISRIVTVSPETMLDTFGNMFLSLVPKLVKRTWNTMTLTTLTQRIVEKSIYPIYLRQ